MLTRTLPRIIRDIIKEREPMITADVHLANDKIILDHDSPFAECPHCAGPGEPLGGLGWQMHFQCQDCGGMFSKSIKETEMEA